MTPVRSPDQVSRQWGRHVARWMAAGVPYLCGGADPEKGLDCWGLMVALYREAWIELPEERAAAASITSVPRSLAAAASPALAGAMLTASGFGWPLVLAGGLKAVYDLLLLLMFRNVRPPEERSSRP